MWSTEHSQRTTADPEAVWARYRDVASWSEWDEGIAWASLDGPFAVGATGRLKPKGGPATRFTVTEADPAVRFTDETRLPFTRLRFEHRLAPAPDGGGTTVTHTVTIDGPLSPLFGRVVGRSIAKGLPSAVRRLAALAAAPA